VELQKSALEEQVAALTLQLRRLEDLQRASAEAAAQQVEVLQGERQQALQERATMQEQLEGERQRGLKEQEAAAQLLEEERQRGLVNQEAAQEQLRRQAQEAQRLLEEESWAGVSKGQQWEAAISVLQDKLKAEQHVSVWLLWWRSRCGVALEAASLIAQGMHMELVAAPACHVA
jgi:hypothetical protein